MCWAGNHLSPGPTYRLLKNRRVLVIALPVLFLLHVTIALAIVQRLVAKGLGRLDRSGAVGPVRSRRPRPFATNRYSYIIARSRTK